MSAPPTRVTLLVHGSTRSTATAAFPSDDESLEVRATAAALRSGVPRSDHLLRGPDRACAQTCDAIGATGAVVDEGLRGWDAGRWGGHTLDDVAAGDPGGVRAWLTDPAAAPRGGESLRDRLERVGGWLAGRPPGHTVAVCGPAVPRAAVVVVTGAPPSAFWRLDAPPLTATDLRGGPSRWTVRAMGRTSPDADTR